MLNPNIIYNIAVWAIPILMAITLHEAGHAWAASRLGDQTARQLGRVTLNPIAHIDIMGTIVVPFILILTSPIIFGWAKPVPVISRNLNSPKRDMAWVAAAGPLANILMFIAWCLLFKLLHNLPEQTHLIQSFSYMALAGMFINLLLAIFNLLPFPPLDGGKIFQSWLPSKQAYALRKVEPYGIFIVLALFMFAGLGTVILKFILSINIFVLHMLNIENANLVFSSFLQRFF